MADMIEAKDAKQILGCDDAALNALINQGKIRAQRVGGKLMLNQEDVEKAQGGKEDDGTIVLTGDSDNLQIDLGKVVDDTSETIASPRNQKTATGTESITFGDELEVVNFDDGKTQDLGPGGKKPELTFTDSNTAVITSVEETQMGVTSEVNATDEVSSPNTGSKPDSSRKSVRAARVRADESKVHWVWVMFLVLSMLCCALLVVPYYFLGMWPVEGEKDYGGSPKRGTIDNAWTSMASGVVSFSVEPDKTRFKANNPDADFVPNPDPMAKWRYEEYLDGADKANETGSSKRAIDRVDIVKVDKDTATSKAATTYKITQVQKPNAPAGTMEDRVQLPQK